MAKELVVVISESHVRAQRYISFELKMSYKDVIVVTNKRDVYRLAGIKGLKEENTHWESTPSSGYSDIKRRIALAQHGETE